MIASLLVLCNLAVLPRNIMAFSRMSLSGQSTMKRKATALLPPFISSSSQPLSPSSFSLLHCLALSSRSPFRWPNGGSRAIISVENMFGVYPPLAAISARSFSSSTAMFSASSTASNGSGNNDYTPEIKPKIPSVVPGIPNADATAETWQNPRSRWARRKHRKKMEKMQLQQGENNGINGMGNELEDDKGALDWESFEFGTRSVSLLLFILSFCMYCAVVMSFRSLNFFACYVTSCYCDIIFATHYFQFIF